jgi:hypothetical protein
VDQLCTSLFAGLGNILWAGSIDSQCGWLFFFSIVNRCPSCAINYNIKARDY